MIRDQVVIIGCGLPSLMSAQLILNRHSQCNISMLDRAPFVGGQYSSFDYGENGYFDQGIHIAYDTNIGAIDEVFFQMLRKENWNIAGGNSKDPCGIYYNGRLQYHTSYVELSHLPKDSLDIYWKEIQFAEKHDQIDPKNALEYFTFKFGPSVAREIFEPILLKLYNHKLSDLALLAVTYTAMDRVSLFEEDRARQLLETGSYRSRIAYPNQVGLPVEWRTPQRAFYPKEYGWSPTLEKFKSKLEDQGVTFFTSAQIKEQWSKIELFNQFDLNMYSKMWKFEILSMFIGLRALQAWLHS